MALSKELGILTTGASRVTGGPHLCNLLLWGGCALNKKVYYFHAIALTLLVAGSWLSLLVAGGLFRTTLGISGSYRSIFKIQTVFRSPQHDLHF